ncbi:hypothetical protein C8R45DRAFT_935223 [Mycena sanguinolenta]|nr:hypothetical protein C8R45DRAFT_935223 [Mycena sanguinolenta]
MYWYRMTHRFTIEANAKYGPGKQHHESPLSKFNLISCVQPVRKKNLRGVSWHCGTEFIPDEAAVEIGIIPLGWGVIDHLVRIDYLRRCPMMHNLEALERLSRVACQNGLRRLAEFELAVPGLRGLACGLALLVLGYTMSPHYN